MLVIGCVANLTWLPSAFGQSVPPIIVVHPQSQTVAKGADVTFSVTATNTATLPISYRFRKGSRNLATNELNDFTGSFTLHNVQTNDAGAYAIGLTNIAGLRLSSNAVLTVRGLFSAGATLVAESCLPDNGVPDPGERVTYEFSLVNTNAPGTSHLMATLEESDGVLPLSDPQTYEGLVYGGPPVTRSFTFVTDAPCGANVLASLRLWDGTNDLGRVQFTLPVGPTSEDCCYDSQAADLSISMAGTIQSEQPGSTVEFLLTVTNHGPGTATGIRLMDPNGPGLQFVEGISPSASCGVDDGGVLCDLADLARGESTTVTIRGHLTGESGLSVTNVAAVGAIQRDDKLASNTATFIITQPIITLVPRTQTVLALTNVELTVVVSGYGPFSYQWQKNGINLADDGRIAGSRTATLQLSNIWPDDAGNYTVVVANAIGEEVSAEAVLNVVPLVAWGANDAGQSTIPLELTNAIAVAAGVIHNVVLKGDGTVVAWGINDSGQTNVPPDLSNVVAIAAGYHHSLALQSNGTVVAWGRRDLTNVPPGLTNITSIAAGTSLSLALRSDGGLVQWPIGVPQPPPMLTNVLSIAAGWDFGLALRSNGTVVAWGYNGSGQTNVPPGLSDVAEIAAGGGHCLVRKKDGTVVAWGLNVFGQTNVPSNLNNVVAIAAGQWHSLALQADGRMVEWGSSYDGQTNVPPGPFPIPSAMDAGYAHSLVLVGATSPSGSEELPAGSEQIAAALDTTKFIWKAPTWLVQNNVTHDGVDALQFNQTSSLETTVRGPGVLTFWWKMAPGLEDDEDGMEFHLGGFVHGWIGSSCWFNDCAWERRVYVIPDGEHSLLWLYEKDRGRPGWLDEVSVTPGSVLPSNVVAWGDWYPWDIDPIVLYGGLNDIEAIAAGYDHTIFLRRNGTVASWGRGVSVPHGLKNVVAVAAGRYNSLALKDDGTLVAWGSRTNLPSGLTNVIGISAGNFHDLALRSDGTVVSWGSQTMVPDGLSDVFAIAAGAYHSLALKNDSTVVAWGNGINDAGQTNVPANLRDVVAIAAGDSYSLALRANGTLVAWGQTYVPNGLTNIVAIEAREGHQVALTSEGTVVSLEPGGLDIPDEVSNVTSIAAGSRFGYAIVRPNGGPPRLRNQPLRRTAFSGEPASFSALATGASPLQYQWRRDGVDLPGGTNSILTLHSAHASDQGKYSVLVSNPLGMAISQEIALNMVDRAPIIIAQPTNRVGYLHGYITFGVVADGSPPFQYQWRSNGVDLVSATNSTLRLGPLRYDDASTYSAVVMNPYGAVISSNAMASVVPVATLASLYTPSYQDRVPSDLTNVVAISGNNLALKTDGSIAMWDEYPNYSSLKGITDAIALAAGNPPLALRADGTVVNCPLEMSNVVAIASGSNHKLALRADGTVFAWGDPYEFIGSDGGGSVPTGATDVPNDLTKVVAVSAGYHRSLALRSDGTVLGWPTGNRFGFGWPPDFATSVPFLSNIVALAVGEYSWHSNYALNDEGEVISWTSWNGNNGSTQLGLSNVIAITRGNALSSDKVVIDLQSKIVAELTNVVAISEGLALIDDKGSVRSVSRGRPVLTVEPSSYSVLVGNAAFLASMAVGRGKLNFQWTFNEILLPGETNNILKLPSVQESHAGNYTVMVSNSLGAITSRVARLTVLIPPRLQPLPPEAFAAVGGELTLSVNATGTPPLRYQWRKNGANIPGATNAIYNLTNAQISDGGSYTVVVANEVGTATSDPILVIVEVPQEPPGDDFADRVFLAGLTNSVGGTNRWATREPIEPYHAGKFGTNSVWYRWVAPASGIATFRTVGSTFDTLLGVYTGSDVAALTPLAEDEDRGGFFTSQLRFQAQEGLEYAIAIDGFVGGQGTFILSWELEPTDQSLPVITTAPHSQTVRRGSPVTLNVEATGTGLTYRWLFNGVPISGANSATLTLSDVQAVDVGLYSVVITNSVGRGIESLPAAVEIGPVPGVQGQDKLEDLFANLGLPPGHGGGGSLAGAFVSVSAGTIDYQITSTRDATSQSWEPSHCEVIGGASKWFEFHAQTDGTVVIDTRGSTFKTVLAVYRKVGVLYLSQNEVACDSAGTEGWSRVLFEAQEGDEYYVVVDGANPNDLMGRVQLNWAMGRLPRIEARPVFDRVRPGQRWRLSAGVSDAIPPPVYQWLFNGQAITGATNDWYELPSVQLSNAGGYSVVVSNALGSVEQLMAYLTAPMLTGEWKAADGQYRLTVAPLELPGLTMVVESSTNLIQWAQVGVQTNALEPLLLEFPLSTSQLFFRVRPRP